MNTVSIPASSLKVGDIMVLEDGRRFHVDSATTNPRRRYNNIEGDMLVDVDVTGIGFSSQRFASYSPSALVTIEVNP